MKPLRLGLLLVALVLVSRAAVAAESRVTLLHWNVENLFDTVDDPASEGDDEYTPASWRMWNATRYATKQQHLARVIRESGADIVTLAEIENRTVLEDLVAAIHEGHGPEFPYILHRESGDHRGIDVAILSRYPAVSTNWFFAVAGQRDSLVARFEPHGRPLTVIMNHWKSRYGGQTETEHTRLEEAKRVRAEVTSLQEKDPRAAIVVVGDFNDDVNDPSIRDVLGAKANIEAVEADPAGLLLFNLHGLLKGDAQGTYYYWRAKAWNSFDSASVTKGMLPGIAPAAPWTIVPDAYGVVHYPYMQGEGGAPLNFRMIVDPKTRRRRYQEGYSDHFPVRMVLTAPVE